MKSFKSFTAGQKDKEEDQKEKKEQAKIFADNLEGNEPQLSN